MVGSPSTVAIPGATDSDNQVFVFARLASDSSIHQLTLSASGYSDWSAAIGSQVFVGSPSAAAFPSNGGTSVVLTATGSDQQVYWNVLGSQGWIGWGQPISAGLILGSASVAAHLDASGSYWNFDVLATGLDSQVHSNSFAK
jgi:hypothetical protein